MPFLTHTAMFLQKKATLKMASTFIKVVRTSVINNIPSQDFMQSPTNVLTLRMASAQVAKTSVANNSPSQGSSHPDDHHFLIKDFPTVLKWGHSFLMLVVNLFTQNGFPIDK